MKNVTVKEGEDGRWRVYVEGCQVSTRGSLDDARAYAHTIEPFITVIPLGSAIPQATRDPYDQETRIDGQTIQEWRQLAKEYKEHSAHLAESSNRHARGHMNAHGLLMQLAYAYANNANAAQEMGKILRDYALTEGPFGLHKPSRPLADAIGRRMETATAWPVPERHKLDNPDKATASDRRVSQGVTEESIGAAWDKLKSAHASGVAALTKYIDAQRCHHMEGQSGLGCDCQGCTCYQGLGFYGSNTDPACPVHGAK